MVPDACVPGLSSFAALLPLWSGDLLNASLSQKSALYLLSLSFHLCAGFHFALLLSF